MSKKRISLIVFVLLCLGWILHHTYSLITPPALLYLPDANQSRQLHALRDQGVPLNLLDYRFFKRYPHISKGWVRFNPEEKLSREEFVRLLQRKPREKTRRIVMYSGMTMGDFTKQTAKQTHLPASHILSAYRHYSPYYDGGILAGYYQIPYRATPQSIAYYMTLRSEYMFQILAMQSLDGYDTHTWRRILIVASIIQKETQNKQEMPLIASVIYNRLATDMKLQLDATLNYDPYSHTAVTPARIKNDTSRYNTYRYKGLPPHPLGSASIDAISAALHPANSDYLYFMLAEHGNHNFATSYAEHLAHIRWYKRQKQKKSQEENLSQNGTKQQLDTIPQSNTKVQQ